MVLGNPAQRLHQILSRFEATAGSGVSINDCWRTTLGCSAEKFPACFQSALSLIPEIRARIESQGLVTQRSVVNRYEGSWLKPFMPDRGWQQHSQGLVDDDSLLAISSLSEIFAAQEPTLIVVDADQSQTLLKLLDQARAQVREESDLPAAMRTLIMDRLHDVQWAVEHYTINGPEGLQAALDRLGAELARTARHHGAWRRNVGMAFLYGWMLFSHADDFLANLEASSTIISEVGDWARDAGDLMVPDRLELPSSHHVGAHEDEGSDIIEAELVDEDDR